MNNELMNNELMNNKLTNNDLIKKELRNNGLVSLFTAAFSKAAAATLTMPFHAIAGYFT